MEIVQNREPILLYVVPEPEDEQSMEERQNPTDEQLSAADRRQQIEEIVAMTQARVTQTAPAPEVLHLRLDQDGLSLVQGTLALRGDLTTMLPRMKQANLAKELLVRAARLKNVDHVPLAVDATAGLGEDALLLATAGYRVRLYEYDPVIAALLADSLRRARNLQWLGPAVARMELHCEDSIAALHDLPEQPDVVLLDPMFPERQKSGLIKKKFQLLQQLERPCSSEEALLEAAIAAGPRKIVIKRPAKGPCLAGRKPDYTLDGKAIRYDCLVFARNQE